MQTVVYQGQALTRPRNREQRDAFKLAKDIAGAVSAAFEGCGLTLSGETPAGVVSVWTSQITSVKFDDPLSVMIRLRAGLLLEDLEEDSSRIAESLGVHRISLTRTRPGVVRLEIPLTAPEVFTEPPADRGAVDSVKDSILFGRNVDGSEVHRSLADGEHIVVQGQTQSGKSTWCYSTLAQLSKAKDVIVAGSDPSGLLLKPWSKRTDQHAGWQALGTQSVAAHVQILDRLVKRMDARLRELPEGQDRVVISDDYPLMLAVLEEFPGLLRLASKAEAAQIRALYGRLLAEGAKAGIRVLIIAQRADAEILGGYERGQCSTRISFSVDSREAVKMLHPGTPEDVADRHSTAPPGTALVSFRGQAVALMHGPFVANYQVYYDRVSP